MMDGEIVTSDVGSGAHDFIMSIYEGIVGFFEATQAPAPLEFTVTTAANIAAAAICDMPEAEQEAALAKAVEMMSLSVRATRMHRAANVEQEGHA